MEIVVWPRQKVPLSGYIRFHQRFSSKEITFFKHLHFSGLLGKINLKFPIKIFNIFIPDWVRTIDAAKGFVPVSLGISTRTNFEVMNTVTLKFVGGVTIKISPNHSEYIFICYWVIAVRFKWIKEHLFYFRDNRKSWITRHNFNIRYILRNLKYINNQLEIAKEFLISRPAVTTTHLNSHALVLHWNINLQSTYPVQPSKL